MDAERTLDDDRGDLGPERLTRHGRCTVIDDPLVHVQTLGDALQTIEALLGRLAEQGLDERDELVRLMSGVRGAVVQIALERGSLD